MKLKTGLLLAAAIGVFAAPSAFADEWSVAKKSGCFSCHQVDKKVVGPAYKDVAAKYKGQAGVEAHLFDKVRAGGSGVWGQIPMAPNPKEKISDDDLKAVIATILKL